MAPFERLKDYSRESITFTNRSVIAFVIVMLLMLVLISRIYYLQVVEHERYAAISENNRAGGTSPRADLRPQRCLAGR
jgi:penicillin-binding protein 2